jgi:hypothetical protein
MDATRFDRLTRSLSRTLPRRRAATLLATAGLGVVAGRPPALDAKKKKKKKKPLKLNDFGCVNVGGACRGNDANCCSNICEGKKPKKGEKDKSRCVAHDASTCLTGQTRDECGPGEDENVSCETSGGTEGVCLTTTGNAPFCASNSGDCFPCQKDADCIQFCGTGAACVPCALCALAGLQTACFAPTEDACVP